MKKFATGSLLLLLAGLGACRSAASRSGSASGDAQMVSLVVRSDPPAVEDIELQ